MSNIILAGSTSGAGTMTVQAPVTSSNRVLTLPDATGTVLTTATAGIPVNGPAFSAGRITSNQSITSSTWTKIQFNSEEFDTNNCYDLTNFRFTPTVAGYYQISVGSYIQNLGGSNLTNLVGVYKNNALYKYGQSFTSLSLSGVILLGTILVYLNGSTDYVEAYAFSSGTSPFISFDPAVTYFQGALVRSAI
jgi:hypothetical protein